MNNIILQDLLDKLEEYNPEEVKTVKKAYEYADTLHQGQMRQSGEPYISHPLNVAYILAEMHADKDTICAGLLHDTLEDTNITKEDIAHDFNQNVANLVDGVTKLAKMNFSSKQAQNYANTRKIITGITEDVRIIIIKLADRLHNMRTLGFKSEFKQKENALETMEIFVPLAYYIGAYRIKSELEDLSLQYLKPDMYKTIEERKLKIEESSEDCLNEMLYKIETLLNNRNIPNEIKIRTKNIYGIYKRLSEGHKLSDIHDLLALKIMVDEIANCYYTLGMIHREYHPINDKFKDYICNPKTNMYQSLHTTVFGPEDRLVQTQIRTFDMDKVASFGLTSFWETQKNEAQSTMQQDLKEKYQFFKSLTEINSMFRDNIEFVTQVKNELFADRIYVYTTKGDIIELPKGSTPIDFAYRVHSQIGDKMTGAIVNNNMVPLTYELKNADIIKVITNNNSKGPSRSWLNIVKTTGAKNKIKSFFNRTTKEDYINQGKDLLEKELRRRKISISDFTKEENLNRIYKEFKLDSLEDIYLNIGNNKFSPKSIIKHEEKDVIKEEKKPTKVVLKNTDNDVIIGGTKNIETHIANCCLPVPGDDIVGFITKTSGIRIHRKDCSNVEFFDERKINATWNPNVDGKYSCEIIIHTTSSENIIVDMVQTASSMSITIENVNLISKGNNNVYSLSVLVRNLEELNKFLLNLSKVNFVNDVERIMR